jgi:integrase
MAKKTQLLTALEVDRFSEPGFYFDGEGLYLQVAGAGAKSWVYRYSFAGKAHWMGLGSAKIVTLKKAREKRDVERSKIASGIDPVAVKKAEQKAARGAKRGVKAVTFKDAVETYLADHDDAWRNAKHRQQWRSTLETYAYPTLCGFPITAITAANIVDILRPIWTEKNETARRVRGRIEAILDYAADPDDMAYRNPAALTAQLRKKLPKLSAAKKPQHHAALPYAEIGAFLEELRERDAVAARLLEFTILTAARTGEALLAKWSELDLAGKVWTIPAKRMKAGKLHRVPLSDAAIAVVEQMRKIKSGDYIFPSLRGGHLSNMAMLKVLQRMGRSELTVHGFRSTFRDWAGDRAKIEDAAAAAEAALAHVVKDKTERSYARSDLFERRRTLMNMWATFCSTPSAIGGGEGNVIRMRGSPIPA